jgi:hypothetical protein
MGWLTLRSGSMPRVLGWILVVGGVRYDLKLWIGSGDVSAAYLPG